MQAKEDYKDIL